MQKLMLLFLDKYGGNDYLNTLGITLLEGRMFDTNKASDSSSFVINQNRVTEPGLKTPSGARIQNFQRVWAVVGVIDDFLFENILQEIGSLALAPGTFGAIISVNLASEDMPTLIEEVTEVWDQFMPNQPIRFAFLDESYARMYADVKQTADVLTVFSVVAVIVACLGLFGLGSFMVEQRANEISIRKRSALRSIKYWRCSLETLYYSSSFRWSWLFRLAVI